MCVCVGGEGVSWYSGSDPPSLMYSKDPFTSTFKILNDIITEGQSTSVQ